MKSRHAYWASIVAWGLLCLGHFVFRTHTILSGPRDDDLYAYSWTFQSIVFLIYRFPLWCLALVALLVLESWHFSRRRTKNIAEQASGDGDKPKK
jgi:amino acid permease